MQVAHVVKDTWPKKDEDAPEENRKQLQKAILLNQYLFGAFFFLIHTFCVFQKCKLICFS